MTKTLAEILAGEDMEGGEVFCDDVYNFLKNQGKDLNLLTNSGFGVWSQSDTNKGLATLVYDNLAGGNFAVGDTITGATSGAVGKLMTDNGATSMTLGAVSGTFQDNEQIGNGAGVTADVNGDAAIGVKNDPCNNDSTGLWTDDGAGIALAFVAAEYTVTTTAVNQRAWIAAAALTAGKLYKIELDIKNGTAVNQYIEGYINDGAAQYGQGKRTAAGWASVFWVFECATTTAAGLVGFRIPANMGGNIEIRRFSCYEITPCCTGVDNLAFDGWYKENTLDIYRQHNDGGTLTKDGSFYSLKMVPSSTPCNLWFPGAAYTNSEWTQQFAGRTVTMGCWVKTSTASHVELRIYDAVTDNRSTDHTGGGDWEWLELTATINANATWFFAGVITNAAPNVDGSTIVYVSQPMLVFGSSIGEGMYQPRQQEWIYFFETAQVASSLFNATLSWSDTVPAWIDVNLEADSDGMLPKGAKAIKCKTKVNDSGSAGVQMDGFSLKGDSTFPDWYCRNTPSGITNDYYCLREHMLALGTTGDYQYYIDASGAGTFDIVQFYYMGVQVN